MNGRILDKCVWAGINSQYNHESVHNGVHENGFDKWSEINPNVDDFGMNNQTFDIIDNWDGEEIPWKNCGNSELELRDKFMVVKKVRSAPRHHQCI